MIVVSDLHIGASRSAGTTLDSSKALRQYLLESFYRILDTVNEDLVLLGDVFESGQIPMSDLLGTYVSLDKWLIRGFKLFIVNGNHDLHTDSSRMSSLQFLAALLANNPNVKHISRGQSIADEIYVIPHVVNQDLFDLELSKVPTCKYLLLHCNYDNPFSKHLDNSLDLSEQQALDCKAEYIVLGHEHHTRKALGGKVFIPGNQIASSIADCIGGHDKYMTHLGYKPELVKVWDSATNYAEIDWRNPAPSTAQFIRFVGHCKPDEAAEMANVIAAYRRSSDAFVITNAVKVGEDTEGAELELASLEAINKFSVMGALKEYLSAEDVKILESLDA